MQVKGWSQVISHPPSTESLVVLCLPKVSCLHLPTQLRSADISDMPALCGCWTSNSCPHAYTASALSTGPSPQPPKHPESLHVQGVPIQRRSKSQWVPWALLSEKPNMLMLDIDKMTNNCPNQTFSYLEMPLTRTCSKGPPVPK